MNDFDYSRDYDAINFREHPELYQIGKGEQGVLMVEPYKSEILPYWRFKTPEIAAESAAQIYELYLRYKQADDFVGMDMARKFLQMGFTRARRYANHRSGRKYEPETGVELPDDPDPIKAQAADIFYKTYRIVKNDPDYLARKRAHQQRYGRNPDATE